MKDPKKDPGTETRDPVFEALLCLLLTLGYRCLHWTHGPYVTGWSSREKWEHALRVMKAKETAWRVEASDIITGLLSTGYDVPHHWRMTDFISRVDGREDNGKFYLLFSGEPVEALTKIQREVKAAVMEWRAAALARKCGWDSSELEVGGIPVTVARERGWNACLPMEDGLISGEQPLPIERGDQGQQGPALLTHETNEGDKGGTPLNSPKASLKPKEKASQIQEGKWSTPGSRSEWARVFRISKSTFDRRRKDKEIRVIKFGQKFRIHIDDLPKAR